MLVFILGHLLAGVSAIFWLSVNGDGFFHRTDVVLSVDVDASPEKRQKRSISFDRFNKMENNILFDKRVRLSLNETI